MALEWNLTAIKGHEDLCYYEAGHDDQGKPLYHLCGVTEALIWYTIPVRLGDITDKNWEEFWTRVHVVESVYGPSVRNPDGSDHHITPEEVKAHIGLHCNVVDESRHRFQVAMGKAMYSEAQSWRRRWEKAEEKVGEEDAAADGGAESQPRQEDGGA